MGSRAEDAHEQAEGKGFDPAAFPEGAGGNDQLLGEMAVRIAAECPMRMQEIREAIARQDAVVLERAVLEFRGSVTSSSAARRRLRR
ncbi:hypothetical protein AYO40_02785 [Planctomycetaceae bacterium SCGC AG-212-D15]|nr:hypothetical protein AYO40_02785 [Planctomycetaceae bacterium SCGC AG-212-D15]